jgi:hypothetical protein
MNQRKNAGRKSLPESKKKVQISVYIEQEIIDKHGGKEKIKELMLKGVI